MRAVLHRLVGLATGTGTAILALLPSHAITAYCHALDVNSAQGSAVAPPQAEIINAERLETLEC